MEVGLVTRVDVCFSKGAGGNLCIHTTLPQRVGIHKGDHGTRLHREDGHRLGPERGATSFSRGASGILSIHVLPQAYPRLPLHRFSQRASGILSIHVLARLALRARAQDCAARHWAQAVQGMRGPSLFCLLASPACCCAQRS